MPCSRLENTYIPGNKGLFNHTIVDLYTAKINSLEIEEYGI